jgi:hypothetical protein
MGRTRLFPFRFAAAYRLPALVFGVTGATAAVCVDDEMLRIRFGPWRVRTPLTNVVSATRTGPFSLVKTMGPAHLSFADRGLTCATNSEAGLCIRFAKPVRGLDPLGLLRHPAVTVTVADCDSLAKALGCRTRGRRILGRRTLAVPWRS